MPQMSIQQQPPCIFGNPPTYSGIHFGYMASAQKTINGSRAPSSQYCTPMPLNVMNLHNRPSIIQQIQLTHQIGKVGFIVPVGSAAHNLHVTHHQLGLYHLLPFFATFSNIDGIKLGRGFHSNQSCQWHNLACLMLLVLLSDVIYIYVLKEIFSKMLLCSFYHQKNHMEYFLSGTAIQYANYIFVNFRSTTAWSFCLARNVCM